MSKFIVLFLFFLIIFSNLLNAQNLIETEMNLSTARINNITAYIPPQCYTKTQDQQGNVYNPCYACHNKNEKPNFLNDSDLQLTYALPSSALENPWSNLFKDRQSQVKAISDLEILNYVRKSNYLSDDKTIILAKKLRQNLPSNWDFESDSIWKGYIPDAYFNFDKFGLDKSPDGIYSGWRAYAYYPFVGTFWPTNGSTDDVLIRLDSVFWTTEDGISSLEVYDINLAIILSLVTRKDVEINLVDERKYNVDLNKDGKLANASKIVFQWKPLENQFMSYIGLAKQKLQQGKVHLAAGLFPEGTEFLHSVRYLDINEKDNSIMLSARMKELRYARKVSWYNYSELKGLAEREGFERDINPDATRKVSGNYETGMFSQGWLYQGFIEDKKGELRPQSQQETLFCMGCHGGLGVTTDTVFSYPRKFLHKEFQNGWFHWSQKGLSGVTQPKRSDNQYEYSLYLKVNKSANEFRSNDEAQSIFFDQFGVINDQELCELNDNIGKLLLPSKQRALSLNKAYLTIVKEQTFTQGRDATILPQKNVYQQLEQDKLTDIGKPQF